MRYKDVPIGSLTQRPTVRFLTFLKKNAFPLDVIYFRGDRYYIRLPIGKDKGQFQCSTERPVPELEVSTIYNETGSIVYMFATEYLPQKERLVFSFTDTDDPT